MFEAFIKIPFAPNLKLFEKYFSDMFVYQNKTVKKLNFFCNSLEKNGLIMVLIK